MRAVPTISGYAHARRGIPVRYSDGGGGGGGGARRRRGAARRGGGLHAGRHGS